MDNQNNLSEVLKSLQAKLLQQKKKIEDQLSRVEVLLKQQTVLPEKASPESEVFQTITEILEPAQMKHKKLIQKYLNYRA